MPNVIPNLKRTDQRASSTGRLPALDGIRGVAIAWVVLHNTTDLLPSTLHGASHLLEQVLEERGRHARAAVGVNELPFDLPVEIDLIIKIKQ